MKNLKPHFRFNRQERSGVFFLLLILVMLQLGYWFLKNRTPQDNNLLKIDHIGQQAIDSLKKITANDTIKLFPFNPNYFTPYKAYVLGLSLEELGRIENFRESGSYFNSLAAFQEVVQLSDVRLAVVTPYLKFKNYSKKKTVPFLSKKSPIKDLNSATVEDLIKVYGIGEKLATRIIKFRTALGGFLVSDQIRDVYGLKEEVVLRLLKSFQVITVPEIKKINVNEAEVTELKKVVYIRYTLANAIIQYRDSVGKVSSIAELIILEGFPADKIDRIKLYLSVQ